MARTKSKEKEAVKPEIVITSLTNTNKEFDFMPSLKISSSMPEEERKAITALKDGTYQPFMAQVEYTAELDPKTHELKKASPKNDDYVATLRDTFDFTKEFKGEVYQKKRQEGQSPLELMLKTFEKTNTPIMPRYYHNPLQYFDHILLADSYVNSYAGSVVDMYVDFIMPKTLKPVLKLRNPDDAGDDKAQQKEIEANQEIIEKLMEVDNFFSSDGVKANDDYLGIPLQAKWKSLITNHLVFGRNCMVFEYWDHLPHFKTKIDGKEKEFKDIPNVLKLIQSIDMGMIALDYYTGKIGGLWMYNSVPFIPIKSMVYLVNKPASPMIGSMYYGFSIMQRCIDAVRILRRILAQNLPQYVRSGYSGMGVFLFDSTQYPDDVRKKIRTSLINNFKAGEMAVIDYANMNDFKYQEIKINADIQNLVTLKESLIKLIVGIMGMPQSLIFDEASATRSTLVGRIISFINNEVTQLRSSIGEQIASQWYIRNFRVLYADKKDILEKFTIGVEFEEMDLETKTEKVERLILEQQLNPYTNKYIGEELGDKDYENHIDAEKIKKKDEQANNSPFPFPQKPKAQGGGTFSVKDSDTQKTASVRVTPI